MLFGLPASRMSGSVFMGSRPFREFSLDDKAVPGRVNVAVYKAEQNLHVFGIAVADFHVAAPQIDHRLDPERRQIGVLAVGRLGIEQPRRSDGRAVPIAADEDVVDPLALPARRVGQVGEGVVDPPGRALLAGRRVALRVARRQVGVAEPAGEDGLDGGLAGLGVEVTGDQGKIDGLVAALRPFGILEMVQSGTVAMSRGSQGEAARAAHGARAPVSHVA